MKQFWREMKLAILMGMVVPGLIVWFGAALMNRDRPQVPETQPESTVSTVQWAYEIPVRNDDQVESCDLEEYLVGVVLGEMPASFEEEALKAQAVVARTYTLRANTVYSKHGDGSVCTDSGCCQAYLSPKEYLSRGGTRENLDKIKAAVTATAGQVLTYEGALIEATYFSCSGGTTEDAVAVWGTDYPYLQSVESPGEEYATHYTDTVSFTPGEFEKALGVDLPGAPDSWFGPVTYTEGGGVDTMVIGGKTYRGTDLRMTLGLRSTVFSVSAGEKIVITTKGFGHRVGMSQYGADAMAAGGSGYGEILAHYYQGTELVFASDILKKE